MIYSFRENVFPTKNCQIPVLFLFSSSVFVNGKALSASQKNIRDRARLPAVTLPPEKEQDVDSHLTHRTRSEQDSPEPLAS